MSYKEDILRLRLEGKTYSQISEELGCSKGTIAYYMKQQNEEEVTVSDINNEFYSKVIAYVDNFKEKRPCNDCGQYLHKSQLDALSPSALHEIASAVFDKKTFEESKRRISQLKFVCANCNRLREFKANN